MERAKLTNDIFNYGDTGLDGRASKLVLHKMNNSHCARFIGMPVVGREFTETTAAHTVRTAKTVNMMLGFVIRDNEKLDRLRAEYNARITPHDFSDVLCEVVIATTEVDPELKKQSAQQVKEYDQIVTPFIYKLALFSDTYLQHPTFFYKVINQMRSDLEINQDRRTPFSIPEVIDFCQRAVTLVKDTDKQYGSFMEWKSEKLNASVEKMMAYHTEIETASTFEGAVCQAVEKADGTIYSLLASQKRIQNNSFPTHYDMPGVMVNGMNSRFEKLHNKIITLAGDDVEKQALAACVIHHSYRISQMAFAMGKPHISFEKIAHEPGLYDSRKQHIQFALQQDQLFQKNPDAGIYARSMIVDKYGLALKEMTVSGNIYLPEHEKTLAASNQVETFAMDKKAHALIGCYLNAHNPS